MHEDEEARDGDAEATRDDWADSEAGAEMLLAMVGDGDSDGDGESDSDRERDSDDNGVGEDELEAAAAHNANGCTIASVSVKAATVEPFGA